MIPTKTHGTTTGSLQGQRTTMTIKAEHMQHIMGVVTDLYSDKVLAVLREYSTNALDAQKDAGYTGPIEITLPSRLNNELVIRDHGTGMSVDDLSETYGMFGASTKRDSNEFNGCLGLGSKSALSYTGTFTVSSVKNGVKAEVVVYRDASGLGQLEIVDTRATDESSGTTIRIPTKPGDSFTEKARAFYSVWEAGTVRVNGEIPAGLTDLHEDLTTVGDFKVKPSNRYSDSSLHVVMGGVTYTHQMPRPNQFIRNIDVWAFVGIGDVDFVPSREALQLNNRTQAKVDSLWEEVTAAYLKSFADRLKVATSLKDAIAIYRPMTQVVSSAAKVEWNGIELKTSIDYDGRVWSKGYYAGDESSTSKSEGLSIFGVYDGTKALLVNRTSRSSLNAGDKSRLNSYIATKSLPYKNVYFLGDNDHELLADVPTVDWQDVLDTTKSIVAKSTRPLDEWEYNTIESGAFVRKFGAIPADSTVMYIANKEIGVDSYYSVDISVIKLMGLKNPVVARVNLNRQEKFARDNPGAIHFNVFVKKWVADQTAKLTDLDRRAFAASGNRSEYRALAGKTNDKQIDTIAARIDAASTLCENISTVSFKSRNGRMNTGVDYLSETYPLANARHYLEHTIIYINSVKAGN